MKKTKLKKYKYPKGGWTLENLDGSYCFVDKESILQERVLEIRNELILFYIVKNDRHHGLCIKLNPINLSKLMGFI